MSRVLLLGESWMIYSVHQKGFDTFHTSQYIEGGVEFVTALEDSGHVVERIPAHLIGTQFPKTTDELRKRADVVVVSDVGANNFLLAPETFSTSLQAPDKTRVLRDFVAQGGGLLMVGGYLTFSGIDAKGRWGRSALSQALPVSVLDRDDRIELPEGAVPEVVTQHTIVDGLPAPWPVLLGLNEVVPICEGTILAQCAGYPLLAVREYKSGRTAAFTSDIAPHWAPPEFVSWLGYRLLFDRIVRWLTPASETESA